MPIISSVGGSKSFGRGNIITTVDTAIVGAYFNVWSQQSTVGQNYSYTTMPGSEITFTTKKANSSFLLWQDISCYQDGNGQGMNGCFYVKIGTGAYTAIAAGGHDGQAPDYSSTGCDTWMGSGHNGVASSFNMKKQWVWSPNQPAGTSITVACGFGVWGASGNTCRANYTGYGIMSAMSVMEFVN